MGNTSNSNRSKGVSTAKLFAVSLGCTILMYIVVYALLEVMLESRDYFIKHPLLLETLLAGSSAIVGVVLSIIVNKKLGAKCFRVYLLFSILVFLLLLIVSRLTWPSTIVVLPQILAVLFMIPGMIVQLLVLGFNYLKAKKGADALPAARQFSKR